jgi:hypothetical protein
MLQVLTCKFEFKSNLDQSREALKRSTSNFAEVFSAVNKNFLAFAKNFLALHETCQRKRKRTLNLSVHPASAGKR